MRTHTLELPSRPIDADQLAFFRFGEIAGRVLLTNDAGQWLFLDRESFGALLAGTLPAEHPARAELRDKGFLRHELDLDALSERIRRKKHFLGNGPHLHVVITTLRCNQDCRYCHASRTDMDQVQTDMSLETAKKVVDLAMQSTSDYVAFEYQGGEPTVNMDVLKFCVEYSREKNRYEGKTLDHSVVTNFTYMTEENAEWLLANDVLVCTSLDGPQELHDYNRTWRTGLDAYGTVRTWMAYFNRRWVEMGRDPHLWHVDALATLTRRSLEQWKDIVDLYVELGIRSVHLRPLNPFGFASKTWDQIGYSTAEFLAAYEEALDYIIDLNKAGTTIIEGTAAVLLKKMLTPDDPNFVDIRSPVGSGTGQVAYNYDGTILPSDEGRMIHAMGDPMFVLGQVGSTSYADVVGHPTVKSMAVASLLDSLPGCASCWNAPYCGVRPLHNYRQTGDLFAQRPNTPKCAEHMTIARLLFERLAEDTTGEVEAIFRRWTVQRPRVRDED